MKFQSSPICMSFNKKSIGMKHQLKTLPLPAKPLGFFYCTYINKNLEDIVIKAQLY